MVIVGYGGLGIELLGLMLNEKFKEEIIFFDQDPVVSGEPHIRYKVTSDQEEIKAFFNSKGKSFVVGVGQPRLRKKLTEFMEELGGEAAQFLASTASISPFAEGCTALIAQPGTGISHHTNIGKSCSLHINSVVGHHVTLGEYATIGPNVSIIGPTTIGDYCRIGSNSVILPNSTIGNNVIIPAGSRVEGNVGDDTTYGV